MVVSNWFMEASWFETLKIATVFVLGKMLETKYLYLKKIYLIKATKR